MRRPALHTALILATAALATSCVEETRSPAEVESFTLPVLEAATARSSNFRAHAQGSSEVPAVETTAQGQAIFALAADGESIVYQLNVANIDDVLMSHIHLAPAGENGPIVVWLYPSAPPPQLIPGRTDGVLAEGVFTADDLVGPLAGMELEDLLDAIRDGGAYVNVHTSANPPGEVRGQIH